MKCAATIFSLVFFSSGLLGQKDAPTKSIPVAIKWVDNLPGDFSFTENWSYPLGVERRPDGRAGCADGGFCPERCYGMMDEHRNVMKDSVEIFYQLLDTTHLFHTIQCEAWCSEWDGTNFIEVIRKDNDSVYCFTPIGIATHCSLQLTIVNNVCLAVIDLRSIMPDGDRIYYCTKGHITIDKNLWAKGIMKADFSFDFLPQEVPEYPVFWKGKVYSKIREI
jgi:hypothetical protein